METDRSNNHKRSHSSTIESLPPAWFQPLIIRQGGGMIFNATGIHGQSLSYEQRYPYSLLTLLSSSIGQQYFDELFTEIEKKVKDYHFKLETVTKGSSCIGSFQIFVFHGENKNGPIPVELCMSCDIDSQLAKATRVSEDDIPLPSLESGEEGKEEGVIKKSNNNNDENKNDTEDNNSNNNNSNDRPHRLHNIWLDAVGRDKLIITPLRHVDRYTDLSPQERSQFWHLIAAILKDWFNDNSSSINNNNNSSSSSSNNNSGNNSNSTNNNSTNNNNISENKRIPFESYPPLINFILNHGSYRNAAHLHLKLTFDEQRWNQWTDRWPTALKERNHQLKQLLADDNLYKKYFGERKINYGLLKTENDNNHKNKNNKHPHSHHHHHKNINQQRRTNNNEQKE